MGFFDDSPPEPEPLDPPVGDIPSWTGPPDGVLPGLAALEVLVGRSEQAAVVISGIRAYPRGFSLTVEARQRRRQLRGDPFGFFVHFRPDAEKEMEPPPRMLRFGMEFADGRKLVLRGHHAPPSGSDGVVRATGGGGGGGHYVQNVWTYPLPPAGKLTFACEWLSEGIELTLTEIDATPILDAASRAEELWPD